MFGIHAQRYHYQLIHANAITQQNYNYRIKAIKPERWIQKTQTFNVGLLAYSTFHCPTNLKHSYLECGHWNRNVNLYLKGLMSNSIDVFVRVVEQRGRAFKKSPLFLDIFRPSRFMSCIIVFEKWSLHGFRGIRSGIPRVEQQISWTAPRVLARQEHVLTRLITAVLRR